MQARAEGLCRFIGVTGHGLRIPHMHSRSLERFDFDAVLFPYNHSLMADPGYRADVEALLERCGAHGVAAQTIKAIARRRWPDDATGPRFSWYQPIEDPAAIARAVRYVLADERVFLNTTSDARLLPLIVEAASGSLDATVRRRVDGRRGGARHRPDLRRRHGSNASDTSPASGGACSGQLTSWTRSPAALAGAWEMSSGPNVFVQQANSSSTPSGSRK